jgi:tetratricopeptide (TPR) repeat protein
MSHSLPFRTWVAILVTVAVVVTAGIWFFSRPTPPPSPQLGTPMLCLAAIEPGNRTQPLYFDRAALPWLKTHWQEWAKAYGDTGLTPEELVAEFDLSLQAPHIWRTQDRKWRFGAVLLTGDPLAYRPLLDYLRATPDWTLKRIDPTSYLFVRVESAPAHGWNTASDLPGLLAAFSGLPVSEQVMARVQLAHRLIFLEDIASAQGLLDEAFKLAPKSKEAWTEQASVFSMAHRWEDAAKAADKVLQWDHDYRPAQMALANAYYALGRFEQALDLTRILYSTPPLDAETYLLHAKVTHAAHAYEEEADVLQRLITLMQGRSQPVGYWQIFRGQALSATGENLLAQEQFRNALKDETLRPSDREFAEKALERISAKEEIPLDFNPAAK